MERKLTFTEKTYLIADEISSPFAIQIVLTGEGCIKLNELQDAVQKASNNFYELTFKLIGQSWASNQNEISVIQVNQENFETHINKNFNPKLGHVSEVLLLNGKKNEQKIIFRAMHSIMDGHGILIWIEEVFKALRGEELTKNISHETESDLIKNNLNIKKRNKLTFKFKFPLKVNQKQKNDKIYHKSIIGNYPSIVSKISKHINLFYQSNQSTIMIPVDLRRHYEKLNSVANLSLPIYLNINKNMGHQEIQNEIINQLINKNEFSLDGIEKITNILPYFILKKLYQTLIYYQNKTNTFPVSGIISHLGFTKNELFSSKNFLLKSFYSIPILIPISPLSFTITVNNKTTELLLKTPKLKDQKSEIIINQLLDDIESDLLSENIETWPENLTENPLTPENNFLYNFHKNVTSFPEQIAISFVDKKYTYFEINQLAENLALNLTQSGCEINNLIAIYLERNLDYVISIIAIIKIGAIFLPLDTKNNINKNVSIIKDSRCKFIITNENNSDIKSHLTNENIFLIISELHKKSIITNNLAYIDNKIAYVIYTSGSTGNPKGVVVGHKSLSNYLLWAKKIYKIDPKSHFALFTSMAFDLTITSFLLPLFSGAEITIYEEEFSFFLVKKILNNPKINSLKITPTHLEIFNQNENIHKFINLIIVGGEDFRTLLALKSKENFGEHCRIFNEYGPTEATVGCMYHEFNRNSDCEIIPIGTPIHNTKIFIVNLKGELVKEDEPGEILISGTCLSLGYLENENLTKEKFVPYLLPDGKKVLVYCTGDLAKLKNSKIIYLGRNDDQIKINGRRIEILEIESMLESLEIISKAIVITNKNNDTNQILLTAFIQLKIEDDNNQNELQIRIKNELLHNYPNYMIPKVMHFIKNFPYNLNGKIDTQKLIKNYSINQNQSDHHFKKIEFESFSLTQKNLLKLWEEILYLSNNEIDLYSNFFHLGGDSLKLIQLITKLPIHFKDIKNHIDESFVNTFMANPTFIKMLDLIEQAHDEQKTR